MEQKPHWARAWWRPALLAAMLVAAWFAARRSGLALDPRQAQERIHEFGPLAPALYILVRAGVAVALIPSSPVTFAAGLLFSPVKGIICVSFGKTLGAALAFLAARYFARDATSRWLSRKAAYRRVDRLTAERGASSVALMRLWPVLPSNFQNYAFGLTSVSFPVYLFWTWLCTLPGAVLVVLAAGVTVDTILTLQAPWPRLGMMGLMMLIMLVGGLYALLRLWKN
ncbi:MAG: TVP38/TMEM64 family protein [Planctomycetes bacterium]|nr:TVP38/TMEM64 family protein [Planctomycetota bacterium]